ncbi:MAG: LysE family transporter, partial [Betaproteobacteria bacterium]
PKVALFFLAFVPQFIPAEAPHKALVFVLLGVLFNLNSVAINVAYAVLASALARRSGALQRARRWLQRAAGLMFIGFGLRLAMSDNPVH